jgi:hypothetical protein
MKRASPILAVFLVLMSALPAVAAGPSREPAPLPDLIQDMSCGFLVEATFPVNDEFAISFVDEDGNLTRLVIAGRLVVTFTNPATGESITANISGPTILDFASGTGKTLGRAGGPIAGLAGLTLFAGNVDVNSGERHGHLLLDVCAALAA